MCRYATAFSYDDGEHVYNNICEIETFYSNPGACHDVDEEGIEDAPLGQH